MDSFTERMVERAQKRREQLKMYPKNPVTSLVTKIPPLKDSNVINRDNTVLSTDILHDRSKILQEVISTSRTSNSQYHNSNPSKISPVSKMASMRVETVLEKVSVHDTTENSKKSTVKDPCELSIADRKALFERNKGQALLPKVPFSQPLPAHKKEYLSANPPESLPPKLPLRCALNKKDSRRLQELGTEIPMSSPQPLPPSLKPDHLKAFMDKVESEKSFQKINTSFSISEHKEQDTSYESIASSESSFGQKIVRLAQKRSKEIEGSKNQTSVNSFSDCEYGPNVCNRISSESLSDIHPSGPTPPKQYRTESFGSLHDSHFDQNSTEECESNQQRGGDFSGTEQPFTQTVSFYRKTQHQNDKQALPLVKKVVHQSVNSIGYSHSEMDESLEKEAVQNKIAELLQKISVETTVISQATQALNLCSSSIEFSDSTEQIEAERLLLLATHRRQAALNEVQRLKVEGTVKPSKPNSCTPSDQGSLTVSEITLPVRVDAIQTAAREHCAIATNLTSSECSDLIELTDKITNLLTKIEEKCHHFVCLLKCNEVVFGTSMITATGKDMHQTSKGIMHMQFSNTLTFPKLYSDFKVTVEIYDLLAQHKEAIPHDVKHRISKKKDLSKFRITPKKQTVSSKLNQHVMPPPLGSSFGRTSKFSMVGYIVFSLREVQRTQFTLNKVVYSNPLDGKVELKLSCELSPSVERRGFLTMFEDVSGFGAWHRRWCLLKGDSLSYWKYPDDERTKVPMDTIDLNTCTAQTITAVNRDICARPNTFLLETIRPARDEDVDSLVLVRHAAHTMVRYLLSTDTKEERIEWCSTLNKALEIIQAWRKK